jgi:sn-glycerol 3-phosphate transport system permease protein
LEKRVVFRSAWLPYALLAPQIAVTLVFFFWPAAQAAWFSFQLQDAFGLSTEFVGLQNFVQLFEDPLYLAAFKVTALFSVLVAGIGILFSLLLACMADRVLRGIWIYRTLLIWPYAVAPVVAGVLWGFLFAPSVGVVSWALRYYLGYEWNWVLQGDQAMALIVMAAVWKQWGVQVQVGPNGSMIMHTEPFFAIDSEGTVRSTWDAVVGQGSTSALGESGTSLIVRQAKALS